MNVTPIRQANETLNSTLQREMVVEVKNVYGKETIYPRCEIAQVIAQIAGTKTLTRETIKLAKLLGFTVKVLTPVI